MTEDRPNVEDLAAVPPFRLEEWLVRPAHQWVERDGARVKLEPKAMQTLVYLASRPGEVFSRTELLSAVWSDTIVGDETLSRIISLLRQVLGDDSRNPRYIETIYKKGYRLIPAPRPAPPEEPPAVDGEMPAGPETEPSRETPAPAPAAVEPDRPDRGRPRGLPLLLAAFAIIAVVATVVAGALFLNARAPRGEFLVPAPPPRQMPLTSHPGSEYAPALSADGRYVAFCRHFEESPVPQVWIKAVDTDSLWQVTRESYPVYQVTWSPDGTELAYLVEAERFRVRTVGVDGSPGRDLYASHAAIGGLDWSPDGTHLVFASLEDSDRFARIRLYRLADGEIETLGRSPESWGMEYSPAFSHDGRRIAFVRGRAGVAYIHVAERDGRSVRILQGEFGRITGLDWAPDSQSLVITHMPEDFGLLQRVDLATGELSDIPNRSVSASAPSVSAASGRIVFADGALRLGIWTISSETGEPVAAPGLNSTRLDGVPTWSHDDRRLAFVSTRSGRPEVWLREDENGEPRRITHFNGPEVTGPRWSHDDRWLAVSPHDGSHYYAVVLDLEGIEHVIDDGEHNNVAWGWSRDSQWLYLLSDRGGSVQTWRVRPDGTGASLVLASDARVVGEMPGGRELLMVQRTDHEMRVRSIVDGTEWRLLDPETTRLWTGHRMHGDAVLFVDRSGDGTRLCRLDLPDWSIETLAHFAGREVRFFTARSDGSGIFFEAEEQSGLDLVLMEGIN